MQKQLPINGLNLKNTDMTDLKKDLIVRKRVHMSLDVRGALRWPKYRLRKLFVGDDGKRLSADDAIEILLDYVAEGKRVIPIGECNNFSFIDGCLGHEEKSKATP